MKGGGKTRKVTAIFLLIIINLVIGGKRSFIFVENMLSILHIYTHFPHKIVLVFFYSEFFH